MARQDGPRPRERSGSLRGWLVLATFAFFFACLWHKASAPDGDVVGITPDGKPVFAPTVILAATRSASPSDAVDRPVAPQRFARASRASGSQVLP